MELKSRRVNNSIVKGKLNGKLLLGLLIVDVSEFMEPWTSK